MLNASLHKLSQTQIYDFVINGFNKHKMLIDTLLSHMVYSKIIYNNHTWMILHN
jgi:hypothetical protein